MRSRIILGALLAALLVIVLMYFRSRTRPPAPPSTPQAQLPAEKISQRQLVADMVRHGITPDRAKALFAMAVGPLPGVTTPGDRDPGDFDGTLAVTALNQVWGSLTPEQQNAATALVTAHHGAAQHAANAALPRALPAVVLWMDDKPAVDYTTLAKNADGTLAAFLGVPGVQFTVEVNYGTPEGTEYAHAWSWTWGNIVGWDKGCHITFQNQKFLSLNPDDAEAVVTHEMFHCFQQRAAQTAAVYSSIHPWLSEGEATWAMSEIVPSAQHTGILDGKWNLYVFGPLTLYSARSYDAIGVYGHFEDLQGAQPLWPKMLPMLLAGANGEDEAAFQLLVQGVASSFYESWGASYFETPGQALWSMQRPGSPPTSGPAPTSLTVDPDSIEPLPTVGPAESALVQVSGGADVIGIFLYTGYGRAHDRNFAVETALVNSAPLKLCIKPGGCTCPDGSPGASQMTKVAIAPISIGLNGGDVTTMGGVAGESLDKFCKKPQQPTPPDLPSPGNGSGGGSGGDDGDQPHKPPPPPATSAGDVHVTTFDGVHYDLQTVGEYTLVRSTKDDFLVQTRQVPVPGSRVASVNQAVAANLGGQRVAVTMESGQAVLRVDGNVVHGPAPRLHGGLLTSASTAFGDSFQLTWPDGTEVRVQQLGHYALNLEVRPSKARRGTLEGLLGNDDGSTANDLLGPGGVAVRPESDEAGRLLANAWHIQPAKSAFDYQPGQSTATFTNPAFPVKLSDAPIQNRAQAEAWCRESGITDPQLLADCVLDLAVTNSFVFGSQYAQAQKVLAALAALAKPASGPAALTTSQRMTGEILDHKSEPEFHFTASQGDVLWIHDPDCSDHTGDMHPVFLLLYDPSGKQVGDSGAGCQFGRRELPATGQYTFRARFKYPDQTVRWSIPLRFVRHTHYQDIAYGQMISGNIDQIGAHDVYRFHANAGDLVVLSGQGCEMGSLGTEFLDEQGHDFLAPNCRTGTSYTFRQSGQYQLLVNSENLTTGPYHFVFQGGKPQ